MVDKKQQHEKLEAEQKLLTEELSNVARLNDETQQWEAIPDQDLMGETDENDAADRFEDFEERTAMVRTLQARYQDVVDAIKKLGDGTYGVCEVGGEAIEPDRLEANPAARTCKQHMNG
jgi:DnaK suppressor protein